MSKISLIVLYNYFQEFEVTVGAHRKVVKELVHSGLYLRCLSRPTDAMLSVGKELPNIRVQWRRLLLRASIIKHFLETTFHDSQRVCSFSHITLAFCLYLADLRIIYADNTFRLIRLMTR